MSTSAVSRRCGLGKPSQFRSPPPLTRRRHAAPALQRPRPARQQLRPRASPEDSTPAASSDSDELLIEQQIARRRPTKAKPGAPPTPFTVVAPIRDQALGNTPATQEQQLESAAVSFLALIFLVIIGEGVFLAASGFLSESADQFAQDVVYPAFSPTLGLFLAASSAYGLWKTRGGGEGGKGQ